MLSWGIRMTFSVIVPLFYGMYFHKLAEAMWIIVAAESIGWVELKGSFAQRVRVLLGGAALAVFFGFAGSISSGSLLLSVLLMLGVVFIASLFKNLGERGSGLSLTVYVMFIIANAYPVVDFHEIVVRSNYILIGGAWAFIVGAVASLFITEQMPYKRSVAFIWKSTAALANAIDQGWDGKSNKASLRDIYLKEKEVNASIDSSLELYEQRAYQTNHENTNAFQMAQLRKSAYLISATLLALAEELKNVNAGLLNTEQRLSIHALLKSIEVICERMTIYTVSSKTEEKLILQSRVYRLQNMSALLRESKIAESEIEKINKALHFVERIIKLIENSLQIIHTVADDKKVFRSYSLLKTLLILHPKHWVNTVKRLANVNTHSFRFALRTAIVATLALFIYKWFNIDHGYWLPFSVMIIVQPYFGATIKKALDRVLGTVLGVMLGGFLLMFPSEYHVKEIMLITSPVLMIYFIRTQYSVATFFISIFLVALFAAENTLHKNVIVTRMLCTVGGAALAIVGEFALLPTWDKKWLPRHIATAMYANYNYFLFTFFPNNFDSQHQWTHYRRSAESSNSNAFDSFNRYLAEPTTKEKDYAIFYQLISHCIRITRELNNYHIESDARNNQFLQKKELEGQKEIINQSLQKFNTLLQSIKAKGFESLAEQTIFEDQSVGFVPVSLSQTIYLSKLNIELNAFVRDMDKWTIKNEQTK